jgi:hypothetical protein
MRVSSQRRTSSAARTSCASPVAASTKLAGGRSVERRASHHREVTSGIRVSGRHGSGVTLRAPMLKSAFENTASVMPVIHRTGSSDGVEECSMMLCVRESSSASLVRYAAQ